MSAVDNEPAFAEAVRENRLHLQRLCVRHRIEMRVQTRNEAFAETADDAGRLDPLLVILKALLRRQPGHADVIGGLTVATRIAEIHDVDGVMDAGRKARAAS